MFSTNTKLALSSAIIGFLLAPVYSLPSTPHQNEARVIDKSIPLRIMPLGDSITWGYGVGVTQGSNGYRQQLLTDLVSSGYAVNFIGTQHTGTMVNNANEGHPGYRISQIQAAGLLALTLPIVQLPALPLPALPVPLGLPPLPVPAIVGCPNVILVHAGTNDFAQPDGSMGETYAQAPTRLGTLVDALYVKCPGAVIIVAKIIQSGNPLWQARGTAYNNQLQAVVNQRLAKGIKVLLVDQSVVGVAELGDGTHPTPAGYNHMGNVFAAGVKQASDLGFITRTLP